jgi:osmotically-inducible protein OsmY
MKKIILCGILVASIAAMAGKDKERKHTTSPLIRPGATQISDMRDAMYDGSWGVASGPNRIYDESHVAESAPSPDSDMAPEVVEEDLIILEDDSSLTGATGMSADAEITQEIRQKIMGGDLSTRAQNLNIVTDEGKVTLRGSVPTAAEKSKVEEMARSVSGVMDVDASKVTVSK